MKVVVVFDLAFGERDDADLGDAFWLIDSPCNRALATRMWEARVTNSNSAVFEPMPHLTPDDAVLGRFEDADLHHPGWTEMAFLGMPLNPTLRRKLAEQGCEVAPTLTGFTLRR
jgi:hypothetical protein